MSSQESKTAPAGGASALTDVLERMRARADNAYCDYMGQLRRDECLGWEIKVERGKFGEAELKAHCAAAEKLGRHRALHEAANMLADVLRSNDKAHRQAERRPRAATGYKSVAATKRNTGMKDLFGNIDEEGMYQMAIAVPLAEKIESAIMLIRSMVNQAAQLSEDGFYVCFSGGKDSIVMAKLFEMSGVKYRLHYNNVTIDPPELVQFVKREYPQAEWHSVGTPLPLYMARKSNGPPTRLARWCCEIYKEHGGSGFFKAIGVRAEESPRRKGLWKQVTNNRNTGLILCPILYWTERDVWQFIRDNGMKYCSLYDEGFKRLGCIGCPMGGADQQRRDFARWPKHEKLWRRGFQAYWDAWKGVPRLRVNKQGNFDRWIERMETVDDLWNWWISGKADEGDAPDCQGYLW